MNNKYIYILKPHTAMLLKFQQVKITFNVFFKSLKITLLLHTTIVCYPANSFVVEDPISKCDF